MIVRILDEKHTFPGSHRAGDHGYCEVGDLAAPKDEDGHVCMVIGTTSVIGGEWGAASVYMSPDEAKKLARRLIIAADRVGEVYAA